MNPPAPPSVSPEAGDLRTYLDVLWRRRWLVIGVVAVATLATYGLSKAATQQYSSSTKVQIQPLTIDTSLFNTAGEATESPDQSLAVAAELAETPAVRRAAAQTLRPPSTAGSVGRKTEVKTDTDAGFLTIRAKDPSPRRAAAIADALASALIEVRAAPSRARIDAAISEIEQQLSALPPSDRAGRRVASSQLQRLRGVRATQGNGAQVIQRATVSSVPVSPRPLRNSVLAFVVSLLVAIGLAFMLDRLDRRVRDADDLGELTGMPLLAEIPSSAFSGGDARPGVVEAFEMLRTNLTYFNIDRPLKSVLVTSPLKGDGKTTVAINLAKRMAQAGKNVMLVDADLRHPQVALRMWGAGKDGFARVLVGERDIDEVVEEVPVRPGRLRVLPSGISPPNPSGLLSSDSMRDLLAQLADEAEVIVLDTPPILSVSDAVPLLAEASGVILVGRVGWTTRDAIRRVDEVISNAGGVILGVVATGTKARGRYGYEAYERGAPVEAAPNGEMPLPARQSRTRRRLGPLRARR